MAAAVQADTTTTTASSTIATAPTISMSSATATAGDRTTSSTAGHSASSLPPDTLISIKILVNGTLKKLKLPLRDLGYGTLLDRLVQVLGLLPGQHVVFERYSDAAGDYVELDANNPQVFRTLLRAARAKLKLRMRATVTDPRGPEDPSVSAPVPHVEPKASTDNVETSKSQNQEQGGRLRRTLMTEVSDLRDVLTKALETSGPSFSNSHHPPPAYSDSFSCGMDLPSGPPATWSARKSPSDEILPRNATLAWSVFCNACNAAVTTSHYHCSICDGGDYDLCERCVNKGTLCPGDGHWLIKRSMVNGKVFTSTTERLSPKSSRLPGSQVPAPQSPASIVPKPMFSASTASDPFCTLPLRPLQREKEPKLMVENLLSTTRTCNNCIVVLPEDEFVTCKHCKDFDLCIPCITQNDHGHHPAHEFLPATGSTVVKKAAQSFLAAGRSVRHQARCDGCDHVILGVRHKCLNCPDFDYCSSCHLSASKQHPGHRFAPIYEPLIEPYSTSVMHYGIYCDGPHCTGPVQQYITGDRYKCTVCNDKDFCATCEASPTNTHKKSHPVVKFKTPVRSVSIDLDDGRALTRAAPAVDRWHRENLASPPASLPPPYTASKVQTVAEIKPTTVASAPAVVETQTEGLSANYLREAVADGTAMPPNMPLTQVWYLRNSGPVAWPYGCSVRFVGGDNMHNYEGPGRKTGLVNESNIISREVKPGEEVAFRVFLRTPMREGKCISYWRIHTSQGVPFGHRLWCDVDVKAPKTIPNEKQALLDQLYEAKKRHADRALKMQHNTPTPDDIAAGLRKSRHLPNYGFAGRHQARVLDILKRDAQEAARSKDTPGAPIRGLHGDFADVLRKHMEKVNAAAEKADSEARLKSSATIKNEEPDVESHQNAEPLESSSMVFPKLEKESPANSTYSLAREPNVAVESGSNSKAAYIEDEEGHVEGSAAVTLSSPLASAQNPSAPPSFTTVASSVHGDDDFEDLEVLSANEDSSQDDIYYLTDEDEYDILDASDEETIASP